jgi:hypothetical protein
MRRILDGSYGVCEQTGKRIPAARLKAVPWTRFREEVEAQLENTCEIARPHLGALRSLRDEPASALAESEPTAEEPQPVLPTELPAEAFREPVARRMSGKQVRHDDSYYEKSG